MPGPGVEWWASAWCRRCAACARAPSRLPRRRDDLHASARATRCRCGRRVRLRSRHRCRRNHPGRCLGGVGRRANPAGVSLRSCRWTRQRARQWRVCQWRVCRWWVRSNALSRRDPWEKRSLLAGAAATALCMARTVCAVQRGRADRERRIRRLTDPLHAPGASATSMATTSPAADDQASTRRCITGVRHPEESGVSLVLGSRAMSRATGSRILRRRSVPGGMGRGFDRAALSACGACAPIAPGRTERSTRSILTRRRR